MPSCPQCEVLVESPSKIWSITDHVKSGNLTESKVGLYSCKKCNTQFPFVYGSKKLKIVSVEVMDKLQEDNNVLSEQLSNVTVERDNVIHERNSLQSNMEKLELEYLNSRAEILKESISVLEEWKSEIQSELTPLLSK